MSSWTGFGSACADPVAEAGPARGQSPVGNVGGAGSREPLQGLDGVWLRVLRVSPRRSRLRPCSCRGVRDGAICGGGGHKGCLVGGASVVFGQVK